MCFSPIFHQSHLPLPRPVVAAAVAAVTSGGRERHLVVAAHPGVAQQAARAVVAAHAVHALRGQGRGEEERVALLNRKVTKPLKPDGFWRKLAYTISNGNGRTYIWFLCDRFNRTVQRFILLQWKQRNRSRVCSGLLQFSDRC